MEELWQKLQEQGLYSKSFEEFQQKYGNEEGAKALHQGLSEKELYSKDLDSFKNRYGFEAVATPPSSEEAVVAEPTSKGPGLPPVLADRGYTSRPMTDDELRYRTFSQRKANITTTLVDSEGNRSVGVDSTGFDKSEQAQLTQYLKGEWSPENGVGTAASVGEMQLPKDGGFFEDLWVSAQQGYATGGSVDEAFDVYRQGASISDEDLQAYITAAEDIDALDPTREQVEFQKTQAEEGGGIWGTLKAIAQNPGFVPQFLTTSVVTMGTSLTAPETIASAAGVAAGGATVGAGAGALATAWAGPGAVFGAGAGAITGGLAGATAGLVGAMETGLTLTDLLKEELGDLDFNKENVRAILEDEDAIDRIKSASLARGLTIGAIEGLTMGLSRGVGSSIVRLGKATGKRTAVKVAGATTSIEMGGGFVGEVGGQVAAGQEIDLGDATLEAIGEAKGIVNVSDILYKSLKGQTPKYKINGEVVSRKTVEDIVNNKNTAPEDLAKINIEVENDLNLNSFVQSKQNDAILETQIDAKVNDINDRKALVELEKKRAKAESDTKKKGVFAVPGADVKLEGVETQIADIINTYAKVDGRTKDVKARKKSAEAVKESVADKVFKSNLEFAKKHSVLYGLEVDDSLTIDQIKARYGEEAAASDGFIKGDKIIINKTVARATGAVNVGNHELLHGILRKAMKAGDISENVISELKTEIGSQWSTVEQRASENYTPEYMKANPDEWITLASDAIQNGDITYNESVFERIGNVIKPILRAAGFKQIKFDTGKDVYSFLKEYNKSIHKGALSSGIAKATKGKVEVDDTKTSMSSDQKKAAVKNVKELGTSHTNKSWRRGGSDAAIKEIKEQGYFDALIASKYKVKPVPRDFVEKVYSEMTPHIKRFKPEQNDNLFAYINSQIGNKAGNVYNSEYKVDEAMRGSKDIDAKTSEGAPVIQIAAETDADVTSFEEQDMSMAAQARRTKLVEQGKSESDQYSGLRTELGLEESMMDKVRKAVAKTFGTKLPEVSSKKFKAALQKAFRTELKKPIQDMIGKSETYNEFLTKNFPIVFKFLPKETLLQMERNIAPENRIFTRSERITKSTEVDKLVSEGLLPKNTNRLSGPTLITKLSYPGSKKVMAFFRGQDMGDVLGYKVGASTLGTRKDKLAMEMGVELGFDATMETIQTPEVSNRRSDILDLTGQVQAENEVSIIGKQIDRDPGVKFSKSVRKLQPLERKTFYNNLPVLSKALKKVNPNDESAVIQVVRDVYGKHYPRSKVTALGKDIAKIVNRYGAINKRHANLNTKPEQTLNEYLTDNVKAAELALNLAEFLDLKGGDGKTLSFAESFDNVDKINTGRVEIVTLGEKWVKKYGKEKALMMLIHASGMYTTSAKIGRGNFVVKDGVAVEVGVKGDGAQRYQFFEDKKDWNKNVLKEIFGDDVQLTEAGNLKKTQTIDGKKINTSLLAETSKAAMVDRDYAGRKKQAAVSEQVTRDIAQHYKDQIKDGALDKEDFAMVMMGMASNMQSPLKRAANLGYIFKDKIGKKYKGKFRYEHMIPTNYMIMRLTDAYMNDGNVDLNALFKEYTVAVIPITMDNIFGEVKLTKVMPIGYIIGNNSTQRYYNMTTFGHPDLYAIESLNPKDKGKVYGEAAANTEFSIRDIAVRSKDSKVMDQAFKASRSGRGKIIKSIAEADIKTATSGINPDGYSNVRFSKSHRAEYEQRLINNRIGLKHNVWNKKIAKGLVDDLFKWLDSPSFHLDMESPIYAAKHKSKFEKLALHYMVHNKLRLPEDGFKVIEAERLAKAKKLDPFSFKNPNEIIEKYSEEVDGKKTTNPDEVAAFTNKQELKNGIVIYDIDDTRSDVIIPGAPYVRTPPAPGLLAVRDQVNQHFGKKSNPWCIVQSTDGKLTDSAEEYWDQYGNKQIIFKDGKLLAMKTESREGGFSDAGDVEFWSRDNVKYNEIPGNDHVDSQGRNVRGSFDEKTGKKLDTVYGATRGSVESGKIEVWSTYTPDGLSSVGDTFKEALSDLGIRKRKPVLFLESVERYNKDGELHGITEEHLSPQQLVNTGDHFASSLITVREYNNGAFVGSRVDYGDGQGLLPMQYADRARTFTDMEGDPVHVMFSKSSKGITVLDFDDTLATTKSNVLYTLPDGTKGKLNAEEFAKQGGDLLAQGVKFDFSEFNKVVKGETAPLFNKAMKLYGKFGADDMFILTARAPESAKAIKQFLDAQGLNIPLKNIVGLGRSEASAKANWIAEKVGEGYNDFYFADDAIQNVQAVKATLNKLEVKNKVQQAKIKFSMNTKRDLKWTETNFGTYNHANFKVGDNHYRITLKEPGGGGQWYLEFALLEGAKPSSKTGMEILDTGRAHEVISIVSNGVFDFIKNNEVDAITFASKETSRTRLYSRLTKFWASKLGWEWDEVGLSRAELKYYGKDTKYKSGTFIISKPDYQIKRGPSYYVNRPVKAMLNRFDVKGKVQQAKIKFSQTGGKKMSDIIDEGALDLDIILEQTKGVGRHKKFSAAKARQRGKNKGKFKFFVPPSADDFAGLMYAFMGKGKQGDKHHAWFKENLFDPFSKGMRRHKIMQQQAASDMKKLRKAMPDVRKKLNKKVPGTEYAYEDAIRVYNWAKAGLDIPGLSKADATALVNAVESNAQALAFAQGVNSVSDAAGGMVDPGAHWTGGNMALDLKEALDAARGTHLQQWVDNKNIIFPEANMNKIEAVYGSNFREALEDSLWRMENGGTRSKGGRIVNNFTNWIHGSIGTTMFLNARSAMLQMISNVNFVNWSDNNMLKAAGAFANQPQYWKDVAMIMNSPFLKQRRSGIQTDVNAAELLAQVKDSNNKFKAATAYLLQLGFTPTQVADSFAIATGGATLYRNRIKTYLKEGMMQAEAETKAFEDMMEIAEETQQSTREDKISQQQASPLGKFILAFQNTPMQYNRLIKKATLDLVNGRGDTKANISRIVYYGTIQNMIFYGLQQALFAALFSDDEEDQITDKKKEKVINGMIDTILRGSGIAGVGVATIKNVILKFMKESEKMDDGVFYTDPDWGNVVIEGLNMSPPIGIKARKIYSGLKTWEYNKDVIDHMSKADIDNPIYDAAFSGTEAVTNLPLSRVYNKVQNISESLDAEHETWKRVAMLLGWSKWSFGIKNQDVVAAKGEVKEIKAVEKEERKEKKKIERAIEKEAEEAAIEEGFIKDQKQERKKGKKTTCAAVNKAGERCSLKPVGNGTFCTIHQKVKQNTTGKKTQCSHVKKDGKRCKMKTSSSSGLCYYHD